jgi:hypothetical protein
VSATHAEPTSEAMASTLDGSISSTFWYVRTLRSVSPMASAMRAMPTRRCTSSALRMNALQWLRACAVASPGKVSTAF